MLALVDPSNVIRREAPEERVDLSADIKPGWRWLPIVNQTNDVSTPGNEYVLTEPVAQTIEADQVLRVTTRRDMAPAEVTEAKDARISTMDRLQFEWLFDVENRLRALEGAPAVTRAQVRTALRSRI